MNEKKLVRNSLQDIAPNNSNKGAQNANKNVAKEPEKTRKKIKPVVKKSNVKQKKRTLIDKFKDSFLGESGNLGDYIMYDVLVPAFRDTISDMGYGIIERTFGLGRVGGRSNSRIIRERGKSYVSYGGVSNDNRRNSRPDKRDIDNGSRARHNFNKIIFTNKFEAEEVLSCLVELTVQYGEVTVRDFYELSNIEAHYTDESYGWTDLRDAYVDRIRDGHIIVFPPTIKL